LARNSGRSAIQSLIADAWSQSAIPDYVHPHTRENRLPISTIRYDLEKEFFILQAATRLSMS